MNERTSNYWSRRVSRRAALRGAGVALAGLAGAALIGCGDDDDDAGTPAPTGTSGATSTPTSSSTPDPSAITKGGTFEWGHIATPAYLSPSSTRAGYDNTFLTLTTDHYIFVEPDGSFNFDRSLVESIEWTDPTTVIWKLRQGVKLHDGSDFNSTEAKLHLDYINDGERATRFAYRALIAALDNVESPDDFTLVHHLSEPNAGYLGAYGVGPGNFFSARQVEALGDDEILSPISTGPYKVDPGSYVSDQGWSLDAFQDYWGGGDDLPYVDKFKVQGIAQNETRGAALQANEIHAAWFTASNETTKGLLADDDVTARPYFAGPTLLSLNHALAPMDNVSLRKAIASAIDKEKIVAIFSQGQDDVATSLLPPGIYGSSDYDPYPFSIEAAKQFVAESGLETPIKLRYIYGGTPGQNASAVQLASLYQEMLSEVGIELQLDNLPGSGEVNVSAFETGDAHLIPYSTGVRPDPDGQFSLWATTYGYFNAGKASTDPEQLRIDDLVLEARQDLDFEHRADTYREIQKILADSVLSAIPIQARVRYVMGRSGTGGIDHPSLVNTTAGAAVFTRFLYLDQT